LRRKEKLTGSQRRRNNEKMTEEGRQSAVRSGLVLGRLIDAIGASDGR
jgi:hypothetical protein